MTLRLLPNWRELLGLDEATPAPAADDEWASDLLATDAYNSYVATGGELDYHEWRSVFFMRAQEQTDGRQ